VTLPSGSAANPTRATIALQVVGTPSQSGTNGQAHMYCYSNGTSGGVTAEWLKIRTRQVTSDSTNIAR
jgi:hypothetical protein